MFFSTCFSLLTVECVEYPLLTWVRKLGVNWPVQGSLKELQPTTTDGDFPECPWGYTWNTDVNSWMSFGASKSESDSNFLHCPQLILYCGLKQLRGRLKLLVCLVGLFFWPRKGTFILVRVAISFQSGMAWSFPTVPRKQRRAHAGPW